MTFMVLYIFAPVTAQINICQHLSSSGRRQTQKPQKKFSGFMATPFNSALIHRGVSGCQ